MFRFKEQRNIAKLNFLCIEVYRETQSYNKDSKNHFGQFKENISEQSLPKNIFIIKKINRFSFLMQIFFCKSCSLLQILCFGIIHIVMNEKGDSFIRIHYRPFLSGNQKQNSWSLNYWIKPSLSWRTLLLRSTNSGFFINSAINLTEWRNH